MYIWLVCCGSIRRLIIPFALNGSYCRSRLKNELWLVCCWQYPSIDNFFRSKGVMLSLTLKERGIHVYLARLLLQYPSIDTQHEKLNLRVRKDGVKNA